MTALTVPPGRTGRRRVHSHRLRWAGADILVSEKVPSQPLTNAITQVRPLGTDIALGGPDADGAVIRMVATNTAEAFASSILQMTQGRTLPGFAASE